MVYSLKFNRNLAGDRLDPCSIGSVLFLLIVDLFGHIGEVHRSFNHDGCALTEPLGFGIMKPDRDQLWKRTSVLLGVPNRCQENACRARPDGANPSVSVRYTFGKNQDAGSV